MTYASYVLYPQHPAQGFVHSRTHKYLLNEHDFGPTFPPPHNRVGGMEWAPRWAVPMPDVVRTPATYKTGLGAEADGTPHLAQTAGAPANGSEQSYSMSQLWDQFP